MATNTICTDRAHYYNQACRWLRIKHIVYSQEDKNIMERSIQYIKDRTECFDDNFPLKMIAVKSMLRTGSEHSCYTLSKFIMKLMDGG